MTLFSFALGNIVGTEIFLPKDAPDYIPGKIAIMVLLIAQLFVTWLLRWINIRLNKKKAIALQALKEANGWSDDHVRKEREKHAFMDMTDKE
jgi:MFS transporter, ACS family, allantoate permease